MTESHAVLNVAKALERAGNMRAIFERFARRFLDEHPDDAAKVRRHLEAGEWEEARVMAHTLKGLAATLGAEALSHAAQRLEQALSAGDTSAASGALIDAVEQHQALAQGELLNYLEQP